MPSDANADTSKRLSRWTRLTEPHTARNCLYSQSVVSDFLSERRPLGITTETVSLPLAKLEGLLELRHVLNMNRVPVSGEIMYLDENVSLRS